VATSATATPPPAGAHRRVVPAAGAGGGKDGKFLDNFFDPQCGQAVPFQALERTRISLSRSHFSHGIRKSAWNNSNREERKPQV